MAEYLSDCNGDVQDDEINKVIDEGAEDTGVSREEFLAAFQNQYKCNPFVFAQNERADAAWAVNNSDDLVLEVEEDDGDVNLAELGIDTEPVEETWQ